jgi:hypothetical protein
MVHLSLLLIFSSLSISSSPTDLIYEFLFFAYLAAQIIISMTVLRKEKDKSFKNYSKKMEFLFKATKYERIV